MSPKIPEKIQKVLKELKIHNPTLLGKGGEGYIFAYKNDTVIKIYTYKEAGENYLQSLKKLQTFISSKNLPFETPQILEIGTVASMYYTIEKRLTGISMEQKFPTLTEKEQYKVLKSYYDAMKILNGIELPDLPYGNILQTATFQITDNTWEEFLIKMLHHRIKLGGEQLVKDVINFDAKVQQLADVMKRELPTNKKSFVHADYFINQVLVNENNEISAVLDISLHTLIGDNRLDVASMFSFEGRNDYAYSNEQIKFLTELVVQDYGNSILKTNDIYKLYYSFYFSEVHTFMPEWYQALIKDLNDEKIWKRISKF